MNINPYDGSVIVMYGDLKKLNMFIIIDTSSTVSTVKNETRIYYFSDISSPKDP